MKTKTILAVVFFLSLTLTQAAAPSAVERAEVLMASQLKKKTHPGFTVLVSRKGEVLFSKAYGMADVKGKKAKSKNLRAGSDAPSRTIRLLCTMRHKPIKPKLLGRIRKPLRSEITGLIKLATCRILRHSFAAQGCYRETI